MITPPPMHTFFLLVPHLSVGHQRNNPASLHHRVSSSLAYTAAEMKWVCSFLTELGITLAQPPVVFCDNVGATYLSANPVFHSRMKHLAFDFHFLRENVQTGALHVTHVSTRDQLADALTKPLPRTHFTELISKIGVVSLPPS